jgi:hypothetical protein
VVILRHTKLARWRVRIIKTTAELKTTTAELLSTLAFARKHALLRLDFGNMTPVRDRRNEAISNKQKRSRAIYPTSAKKNVRQAKEAARFVLATLLVREYVCVSSIATQYARNPPSSPSVPTLGLLLEGNK